MKTWKLAPGPFIDTVLGENPGAILLLCQCCRRNRQILAEVHGGKVTIEKRHHGDHHYVVLGPDLLEELDAPRKIWCMCCDEETRLWMAECQGGLLVIRTVRHRQPHVVAVGRTRLEALLAQTSGVR